MQLRVVIVGFGTVGGGLAQLLAARRRELAKRGLELKLVGVLDSASAAFDSRGLDPARLLARKKSAGRVGDSTLSASEVMEKADGGVLVELTPGTTDGEPALSRIREALKSSRSVVTANKMPLALHYTELLREAERRGVKLLYGACVGGGMPILELGAACAAAEPVDRIEGVLNATTNFVLTEMEKGASFAGALREAQRLGYAEPEPSFDVDGLDAACKVVILANHVMGKGFRLKDVKPLAGIGRVTLADVTRAKGKGRALRLVARAGRKLSVGVAEVGVGSPLAVRGPSHSVVFRCRYSGERAVTGTGAGSITTSLGVLRDLITLAAGQAPK